MTAKQADQREDDEAPSSSPDEAASARKRPGPPAAPRRATTGPDPVIGAGVTLLGIFLMGIGGAGDMHYLFNAGTLVAVAGAVLFVLFVTLTALRQRPRSEATQDP